MKKGLLLIGLMILWSFAGLAQEVTFFGRH